MTTADFWTTQQGGRWRTARKPFLCRDRWFLSDGTTVRHSVNVFPGERYFDTNEHRDGSYWGTIKICSWCANRELAADASYRTP